MIVAAAAPIPVAPPTTTAVFPSKRNASIPILVISSLVATTHATRHPVPGAGGRRSG